MNSETSMRNINGLSHASHFFVVFDANSARARTEKAFEIPRRRENYVVIGEK